MGGRFGKTGRRLPQPLQQSALDQRLCDLRIDEAGGQIEQGARIASGRESSRRKPIAKTAQSRAGDQPVASKRPGKTKSVQHCPECWTHGMSWSTYTGISCNNAQS